MKEQFLNLTGLTELVGYLKTSIANHKEILPYASNKLFPSVGDINTIYIDTATNTIYRWDSSSKTYVTLAKAVKSVVISEATENGKITLTVDGNKTTVPIHGLGSAAYTNSSAYSPAGHTHTKAQVGLGNVDNTADANKSVKHAITANSATTAGTATNVSAGEGTADAARHVWFSDSATETKRAYSDKFKYNPVTNNLTVNVTGNAATASSVAWGNVTGKPSTYAPSAHNHDDSTITSLNASKLFGTIDIARLPYGALERCVIVADDTARFALTTAKIQLGDTVKVNKTQKMYFVIDDSKLNSEAGYTVYTAGSATSVPWSGVTGKPTTFTPSSHTHPYLSALSVSGKTITYTKGDGTTGTITTQDTWRGIQNNLTSTSTTDSLAAAQGKILKGLVDGKLSLSGGTLTGRLTIKGDAGSSPLVVRGIAGSDGQGDIRELYLQYGANNPIYLGNTAAYSISSDGSLYSGTAANAKAVPWTGISGKPSVYPPADHSHAYLPLSGGTMTGSIFISDTNSIYQNQRSTSNYTVAINWRTNSKGWYYDDNGTSKKYAYDPQIGQHNTGGSDGTGSICILPYATNAQPWQQNVGLFIAKNILKLDGNVVLHSANYNSYAPTKTGTGASGTWGISVTGNAATATKLATARSINGTNFDGSGSITTATWGTARNVTIGNTKKSVNGSANVSWSLSEIGAAASSHSHSYLPLSGGTLTGNLNLKPASGEGGEIHLDASTANRTENGIILDQQGGNFRIFGVPSADGTTKTGSGTPLVINPYSKTITGGYTLTGALSGNASTATALTSSAGSATQPVYFTGGKPSACTYTLGKSVPSNAVFTDTNTKVTQTAIKSSDYTNWRTIPWGSSNNASEGFTPTTVTDVMYSDPNLTYQPSSGTLKAKVFKGSLSGNAATASKLATTASITGGNGNTTGYRLIASHSLAAWSNYRATFIVNSRHEGAGILSVAFGCNAEKVSQANAYGEIRYFGLTSSGSVIASDSFQIYISANGATAYLFEKYWDYSTLSITQLAGDFSVSNGTWVESIASATYGALKASTLINEASSVAWGNVAGRPSAMPASDVYAWAKASSKPSYSWGEITGKPSTFTPASHSHNYAGSSSAGGNANAAVKLATARKIGSASFDGTADITLSQMGLNVPVEITKANYLAKKKAGTLNANTYYNVIDEYDSANVINDSSVTANSAFSSTKSEKTYAKKSAIINTTLTASKWTGSSAPYTYVLPVSGATTSNIVEINYASNASSQAIEAYQNAMLADGGQTTNQITIKATEKPTVDIPITIVIRNDL